MQGEELASAYASSEIFLFPSDTETFGNVTLEAMASGLPTVCANASGSDLLVLNGRTGYLAPSQNSSAFLSSVRRLIEDPSLRQKLGLAARTRAVAFEWKNIMGHLAGYYKEIWDSSLDSPGDELAMSGSGVRIQEVAA